MRNHIARYCLAGIAVTVVALGLGTHTVRAGPAEFCDAGQPGWNVITEASASSSGTTGFLCNYGPAWGLLALILVGPRLADSSPRLAGVTVADRQWSASESIRQEGRSSCRPATPSSWWPCSPTTTLPS